MLWFRLSQRIGDETVTQQDSPFNSSDAARAFALLTVEGLRAEWATAVEPPENVPPTPPPETVRVDYDRTNVTHIYQYGDVQALQDLIAQGVSFHDKSNMVLRTAVQYGDVELLRQVIELGANIHGGSEYSLRWAAEYGMTDKVALLLDCGADIHVENDHALHWAARHGYTDTVRLLLDRGAYLHSSSDIAMHWAAQSRQIETLALLVERGAPLEKLNPQQQQAHHLYKQEQADLQKRFRQAEQSLATAFNAAIWVGQVPEMVKLWSQVPERLQATLDFQSILSETRAQTMKRHKPKLVLRK
jgi:hypothetical protein